MRIVNGMFLILMAPSLLNLQTSLLGQSSAPVSALAEPYHQVQFSALLQDGFQRWEKGYLITHAWNGTLETSPSKSGVILYDKNGRIAREVVVWLDGARTVSVGDAAVSNSSKVMVVGGLTTNQDGAIANFIAEIGEDNHVRRAIRTSPYLPVYVCALDDGTVWTYGVDRDDHLTPVQNSLRLRHYSFDKGQLLALLDTSTLGNGESWLLSRGRYPGEISFRCNSKMAVLYNAASSQLVEIDFQTNSVHLTKVAPLPSPPNFQITGFAQTESGVLFASFYDRSAKPALSGLFQLKQDNAGTAKWLPVEGTVGPYLHGSPIQQLLGADSDDLVYTRLKDGKTFWSKKP